MNSMILFLQNDSREIGRAEKDHSITSLLRFAKHVTEELVDDAIPNLIGVVVGITRNDDLLIQRCGEQTIRAFRQGASIPARYWVSSKRW